MMSRAVKLTKSLASGNTISCNCVEFTVRASRAVREQDAFSAAFCLVILIEKTSADFWFGIEETSLRILLAN